ncbi:MAG: hypothetical protein UEE32_00200, partial [Oscillospiraceae bacterium]|nr:hypothetical protein [Oscillospiraceae bacterium]
NTEVKLISAENTCLATDWEDRSMPTQFKETVLSDCLFFAFLSDFCHSPRKNTGQNGISFKTADLFTSFPLIPGDFFDRISPSKRRWGYEKISFHYGLYDLAGRFNLAAGPV